MSTKELLTFGIAIFLVHCEEFRPRPTDASRPQDAEVADIQDVRSPPDVVGSRDAGVCSICNGDGVCRDFESDRENCGGCGARCAAGMVCAAGRCALDCGPALATCVNVVARDAGTDAGTESICVDFRTDRLNCGACNNLCPPDHTCNSGACRLLCPSGQIVCGATCTDLTMDTANCGTCGTNCAARMLSNVATPACLAGMCAVGACAANFANCDMAAANGCEVNTQTSIMHCGGCGRACAAPTNAVAVCRAGNCDFTCMAGFSDCDRNPANGCETNLATNADNCMMCGNRCTAPVGRVPLCQAGTCGTGIGTCPEGRGDCNAMDGDGCETNTFTGVTGTSMGAQVVNNCGACGNTCRFPNAGSQCLAGTCVIGACTGSFRNCNGDQNDGCEDNTQSSTANCGACGLACGGRFPNATPTCNAGTCALAYCNPGFANCNNMASDGCEIDTRNNPSHCGRCFVACAAGQQCINSVCTLVCTSGRANCSGRCVDLNTDNGNCGACDRICSAGRLCSSGACVQLSDAGGADANDAHLTIDVIDVYQLYDGKFADTGDPDAVDL